MSNDTIEVKINQKYVQFQIFCMFIFYYDSVVCVFLRIKSDYFIAKVLQCISSVVD